MTRFIRTLLPLTFAMIGLAGCVAYPAGYGDAGYAPGYAPAVAVSIPCCTYGGGGYGYGYHRWN